MHSDALFDISYNVNWDHRDVAAPIRPKRTAPNFADLLVYVGGSGYNKYGESFIRRNKLRLTCGRSSGVFDGRDDAYGRNFI